MAVRIDMDMPKMCDECPFAKPDNLIEVKEYSCTLILDLAGEKNQRTVCYWERLFITEKGTRNGLCPLKEIKEK